MTEQKCGHQSDSRTPESSNQIHLKIFYKFHVTRANLNYLFIYLLSNLSKTGFYQKAQGLNKGASQLLSRSPLLISGILLFIVTLEQCLERCIHRRCIKHTQWLRNIWCHNLRSQVVLLRGARPLWSGPRLIDAHHDVKIILCTKTTYAFSVHKGYMSIIPRIIQSLTVCCLSRNIISAGAARQVLLSCSLRNALEAVACEIPSPQF